ncbi:hypothetical protein AUJ14_03980 [Candidatus Micrarchaeota archaeon CG1_02_55_22]|nr:MAG: hypothetical protein AUJ14_03980 [Candidatus Micrarchaeota archaeon CG1_02_55_22]
MNATHPRIEAMLHQPRGSKELLTSYHALKRESGAKKAFTTTWHELLRHGQKRKALQLFTDAGHSPERIHAKLLGMGEASPSIYRHFIDAEISTDWAKAAKRMQGDGATLAEAVDVLFRAGLRPEQIGLHAKAFKPAAQEFVQAARPHYNDDELFAAMRAAGFTDAQYHVASNR